MSQSDRAGAIGAQSVVSQSRVSRLSSVYVSRTANAHTWTEKMDQLDGLVLSNATHEMPLDTLLDRVPCSKRVGLDRVRRLANLGLLEIHRVPETPARAKSDAPAAKVASIVPPTPHRVFRRPQPE